MGQQTYSISDLKRVLGSDLIRVVGSEEARFSQPAAIAKAGRDSITFCRKKVVDGFDVSAARPGVVLCTDDLVSALGSAEALVIVKDPRLQFLRVLERLFPRKNPTGIHATASIDSKAKLGTNVYVGPNVVIGRATIGDGCRLDGGVFIYDDVTLGKNVHVKAGAVIGGAGFGFQKNEEGEWEKLPHLGGVVIEDDVEIGSNTCIDRGTLDDTRIGQGTKVDNLVHIAHNAVIGKNCAVIALAEVSGSVRIGDGAWISPCASVLNGVTVGKDTMIGIGAIVTKPVEDGHRVLPAFSTTRPPKEEKK